MNIISIFPCIEYSIVNYWQISIYLWSGFQVAVNSKYGYIHLLLGSRVASWPRSVISIKINLLGHRCHVLYISEDIFFTSNTIQKRRIHRFMKTRRIHRCMKKKKTSITLKTLKKTISEKKIFLLEKIIDH